MSTYTHSSGISKPDEDLDNHIDLTIIDAGANTQVDNDLPNIHVIPVDHTDMSQFQNVSEKSKNETKISQVQNIVQNESISLSSSDDKNVQTDNQKQEHDILVPIVDFDDLDHGHRMKLMSLSNHDDSKI